MFRILIITQCHDAHALAVQWGLRQLGQAPVIWYWSNFPKNEMGLLRVRPDGRTEILIAPGGAAETAPFDVIWVRRKGLPAPLENCHPDDVPVVTAESLAFIDDLMPHLAHAGTRWVNDSYGTHRPRLTKAAQLVLAAQLGFTIPDTLFGNDVGQIRAFFDLHRGRIVHKSYDQAQWDNADGSLTMSRTSVVTAEHLANDYALRACPGIYQPQIDKKFELRVTVMGDRAIAAAIDSQQAGPTVDWRCEGGRGDTNLRAIELEPELSARCVALCRALNVAFGCIDLIVKPDGGVVFLEINSGGQFLFKEFADPSLTLLDVFCRFLLRGSAACPSVGATLHLADYLATAEAKAEAELLRAKTKRARDNRRKAA
jgi:glutathione synthase/RimK-type ligase-like ATP-grasp enzyme